MCVALIIPAAGLGRRLKRAGPKALVRLGSETLLSRTLKALTSVADFEQVIVAADRRSMRAVTAALKRCRAKNAQVVEGGGTRAESVRNALKFVDAPYVAVHDAARPLVDAKTVLGVLKAMRRFGGAIAAVPVVATIKRLKADRSTIRNTEDRSMLMLAQTPQAFRTQWLRQRYRALGKKALKATDEAQLFDGTRRRIKVVPGSTRNLKITTPEDLRLARFWSER